MRVAVVCLLSFLAGCAGMPGPPPADTATGPPPLAPRTIAKSFTASGRIAARGGVESIRGFSGGFSWAHRPGSDTIELLTPLGQTAARVEMTPAGASIRHSDASTTWTADPERYLSDS